MLMFGIGEVAQPERPCHFVQFAQRALAELMFLLVLATGVAARADQPLLYATIGSSPGRVAAFSSNGATTTVAPIPTTPSGLALDHAGNLYVGLFYDDS